MMALPLKIGLLFYIVNFKNLLKLSFAFQSTSPVTAKSIFTLHPTLRSIRTQSLELLAKKRTFSSSSSSYSAPSPAPTASPTQLSESIESINNSRDSSVSASTAKTTGLMSSLCNVGPRGRSAISMSIACACHFGGYEFLRNSCLALFTSTEHGFQSPAAFPFATAMVSPFSVLLLWIYSRQLESSGPRAALFRTTLMSLLLIGTSAASLSAAATFGFPKEFGQFMIGLTYLFQNSYQYLLYTQQWSFLSSVCTPDEGSRWFATIAGVASLTCTFTSASIGFLTHRIGLYGLMACTCITLTICLITQDIAYSIAQKNNFEPSKKREKENEDKVQQSGGGGADDSKKDDMAEDNQFTKAVKLFRRVPPLRALMCETLAYQSFNTILNVAFVGVLKSSIPNDIERSGYTGNLYSLTNACSAVFQFLLVPIVMKYAEPSTIWRFMPILPLCLCFTQIIQGQSSLTLLASAVVLAKVMDYSFHSVVTPMVYQPLDFQSRYVGKEIIGVLGSRFGKSGMSLILSALTATFSSSVFGVRELVYISTIASMAWTSGAWWLSFLIPKQKEAQAIVQGRSPLEKEKKL